MKIALVSFSNPFVNTSDGGKIDIINRIKSLNNMGIIIDHFSILKKNEKERKTNMVNKNCVVKVENKLRYLFSSYPISVNNRYNHEISKQLKDGNYDYYILENFNMIRYLNDIPKNAKVALRVHNIESLSRRQLAKANCFSIKAFLELVESFKYKKVEKQCLERVDKFLFISQDEKAYMENKYKEFKDKYYWIPPISECNKCENLETENKFILYYGDLTVSHNITGIKKFLKHVYKRLYDNTKIQLKIVGKISEDDKKYLSKYKGVEIKGYVEDLDALISESVFIIAPIYTGAGVKIKVVHAMGKGKTVITTPKGMEGTGLEKDLNVLSAESYEEYYEYCIAALDNDPKISRVTQNGYEFISKYYSQEYNMKKMKEILDYKHEGNIIEDCSIGVEI